MEKKQKIKVHVLMVAKNFMSTHRLKKGQKTYFPEKIQKSVHGMIFFTAETGPPPNYNETDFRKIHTIREDYELWKKRVEEVQRGEAVISVRYWEGRPYHSNQVRLISFNQYSPIGVEKLEFGMSNIDIPAIKYQGPGYQSYPDCSLIAKNDGLSREDFIEWFRKSDLSKPKAIIHFTEFRYSISKQHDTIKFKTTHSGQH